MYKKNEIQSKWIKSIIIKKKHRKKEGSENSEWGLAGHKKRERSWEKREK
jgi:hypothetical protein